MWPQHLSTMLKWTVVTKPETFRKRIVVGWYLIILQDWLSLFGHYNKTSGIFSWIILITRQFGIFMGCSVYYSRKGQNYLDRNYIELRESFHVTAPLLQWRNSWNDIYLPITESRLEWLRRFSCRLSVGVGIEMIAVVPVINIHTNCSLAESDKARALLLYTQSL